MPTIKFVRVERDCGANKTRRAGGFNTGIIYDFDVMIDGEKRAAMSRTYTGKGYTVQDADGRPVDPPLSHYATGRRVDSKSEFLSIVSELLDSGKIPTLAQLQEKRAADAKAKADAIIAKKAERRSAAITLYGIALYDALKLALPYAAQHNPAGSVTKRIEDVLKAVDGQVAEWTAAVDAEPGRFGIY